ncbi:MAG: hypothetical protein HQL20_10980 [Candidatus Omnitrophica bacterium]|nr:hypothetical protein [Candidatus Omnitrophota bacterium]
MKIDMKFFALPMVGKGFVKKFKKELNMLTDTNDQNMDQPVFKGKELAASFSGEKKNFNQGDLWEEAGCRATQ